MSGIPVIAVDDAPVVEIEIDEAPAVEAVELPSIDLDEILSDTPTAVEPDSDEND
jgi:hypothetical protein